MLQIKNARTEAGLSQKELAARIGTTQQTIQRWETGYTEPKVTDLMEISRALGVTLSYLLGMTVPVDGTPLSDNERELVNIYRQLPPEAKRAVIAGMKAYLE